MIKRIILLIITLGLLGAGYWLLHPIFAFDSNQFDAFIKQFGWRGPIVMMGLIIAEVVIAPLPGAWLSLATGYQYGPLLGFIYAYTANFIGGWIMFELGKYFGQPLRPYLTTIRGKLQRSPLGLGALYAIPLFPIDLLSPLLGILGITRKRFALIMGLGLIPNMVIANALGEAIGAPDYRIILISLIAIVMIYFILQWMRTATTVNQPTHNPK